MRSKRASLHLGHEETSFVTCQLCGKALQVIATRHLVVHGVDRETYMREFGLTPDKLVSDRYRRAQSTLPGYIPYKKEDLVSALKDILKVEGRLNAAQIQPRYSHVYTQVCWLFGSWDKGLEACGLNPDDVHLQHRWPKEKVLATLRQAWQTGGSVKAEYWTHRYPGLLTAAKRYYRTWRDALVAAGIDLNNTDLELQWSKEKVIAQIKKMGRSKRDGSWTVLGSAAARHFGSMRKAVEAAGIDLDHFYGTHRWSPERVLRQIRTRQRQKRPMNYSSLISREERILISSACYHFGTWKEALTAAGIDYGKVAKHQEWSKELIVSKLKMMRKSGESLSSSSVRRHGPRGLEQAIRRHFGSMDQALRAAGGRVTPRRRRKRR